MSRDRLRKPKKVLKEDRLERTRATVAEQLAQKEKLEQSRKKRQLRQVRPIKKAVEPDILSVIFATVLSVILGMGFTCMMTTTHSLKLNAYVFFFALAVVSFATAYCHAEKSKLTGIIMAAFLLMIAWGCATFNILRIHTQVDYVYSILQRNAFHALKPIYTDTAEIVKRNRDVTLLLILINFVPAYSTTYVVIKRRNILFSLIFYIPFLVSSVAISYIVPKAWTGELAVSGVLLLLIFQYMKRLGDSKADDRMLKITVPVLLVCLLVGSIFPAEGYDRNLLAEEKFTQVQDLVKGIGRKLHIGEPGEEAVLEEELPKDLGYQGSFMQDEDDETKIKSNTTREDLTRAGFFDPPDVKILEMTRNFNDNENHTVIRSGRMVYLRTGCMEVMEGNAWSSYVPGETDDPLYFFSEGYEIPEREADFVVKVKTYVDTDVYFVPGYVDNFFISPASKYQNIPIRKNWNLSEKISNPGENTYYYAYNMTPQKSTPDWNPEYLENEVYGVCVEIPEKTRTGILESGVLPQWFFEVMDGTRTMSTAEKVAAVIEFVRTIHPYDAKTPYPPEDVEDFVTWFLTKSKSGFCVHYATTSAVLLRMLGVPTRYSIGYLVSSDPYGKPCDVMMNNAHAWFEFFDPDYGWILDDATPGNGALVSFYNATAIAQEYGDMVYDRQLSPTPTPKPAKKPTKPVTPTPTVAPVAPQTSEEKVTGIIFHPALLSILIVAAVIFLLRLLYVLFWRWKFGRIGSSTINQRASGYGLYYRMHSRILGSTLSRVSESIRKKAEFGRDEITEEELSRMVKFGEHNLEIQKLGRSRLQRALSKILRVSVK
ncbi:MAG: transglutaminase domain-containing protein [Clostridiales bacterium]|nr:transglutaminase domain-containing protein [Clostridiales bacterium]